MTYLSPAGWDGLVAKAGDTSAASIPVTGFGLDSHEQNAAIGLVTSATARQPPCTLGSMWRHARTAQTDTTCIHTD